MYRLVRATALVLLMAVSTGLYAAKDPTRPPGGSLAAASAAAAGQTAEQAWRLESVMMAAGRSVAIINGTRVKEGDSVAGGRVLRIDTEGVDIIVDNRRQRLYMHRPLTKNWKNRDQN